MSQPPKEVQPPSYEEAMYAPTEAPQVGMYWIKEVVYKLNLLIFNINRL